MASNVARNLGNHYQELSVSTRRLSSGLRIGTAADDAAGLAVRELMRSDVSTLNQGIRNANDAISMIQTADGALEVIDEKLIRMKELSEQASTGTYTSDQRIIIDSEFQAMASEIQRIASATEFNGIKLLDGSSVFGVQGVKPLSERFKDRLWAHWEFDNNTLDSSGNGFNGVNHDVSYAQGEYNEAGYFDGSTSYVEVPSFDMNSTELTISVWVNLKSPGTSSEKARQILSTSEGDNGMQLEIWGDTGKIMFDATNRADSRLTSSAGAIDFNKWHLITATVNGNNSSIFVDNVLVGSRTISGSITLSGVRLNIGKDDPRWDQNWHGYLDDFRIYSRGFSQGEIQEQLDAVDHEDGFSSLIQFGKNDNINESSYYVNINSATLSSFNLAGVNIKTQNDAQKSLVALDKAMVKKDNIRANLGAVQNRLENTISNLQIQSENLQGAESQISDTDVAEEMTNFVKQQILSQAATAMLTQANSIPKIALQIITG